MKRLAVTLAIATSALTLPAAANASGVIANGFGSSPGSVRPATGVIVQGFSTSPRALYPHTGVIQSRLRPHAGIVQQRFRPQTGIIQRFSLQGGVLQQ